MKKHKIIHAKPDEWIHVRRDNPQPSDLWLKVAFYLVGGLFIICLIKEFFWWLVLGAIGWGLIYGKK